MTKLILNPITPGSIPVAIGQFIKGAKGDVGPQGPIGLKGDQGVPGPIGPTGIQGDRGLTGPQGPQGIKGDTGIAGPVGPQGPIGVTGAKGDKGDKGDTGVQGVQGPIGLTGPQGVVGPKGATGEVGLTGAQGAKGDTGAKGIQGDRGITGLTGPQGVQGVQGPIGVTGATGAKGDKGDTGSQGVTGAKGDKGDTGLTGLQGIKGDTGIQGAVGPQGPIGLTGVAGPKGDTGSKGDQGSVGAQGPIGATGPQGIKGETGTAGATGIKGDTGDKGDIGLTGPQGLTGAKGDKGEKGNTGAQGDIGPTGLTGADGVAGPIGAKGDKGDVGPAGPKGDTGDIGPIGQIGPQGNQGLQGVKGATGPIGVTGPAGPTGATGVQGPKGDQGLQGSIGPAGPTGATGAIGSQGVKGDTGATGPIGLTGAKGDKGDTGIQGVKGDQGVAGPKGDKGDTGATGAIGPQGPAGTVTGTYTDDQAAIAGLGALKRVDLSRYGDLTTNAASALQSIVAAGNVPYIPPGKTVLVNNASVTLNSSTPRLHIVNDGVLVYSKTGRMLVVDQPFGTPVTVTAISDVTYNSESFTRLTLSDMTGIAIGQIVKIYCDAKYPWVDPNGDSPFIAETVKISVVDTTASYIYVPTLVWLSNIAAATTIKVAVQSEYSFSLTGTGVISGDADPDAASYATAQEAIRLQGVVDPVIQHKFKDAWGPALRLESTYQGRFTVDLSGQKNDVSGTNKVYGYGVYYNRGCTGGVFNIQARDGRHPFTSDFDDSKTTFAASAIKDFGGPMYPQVTVTAIGTRGCAVDTHAFLGFATLVNCKVVGVRVSPTGSGTAGINNRGYGTKILESDVRNCAIGINDDSYGQSTGKKFSTLIQGGNVSNTTYAIKVGGVQLINNVLTPELNHRLTIRDMHISSASQGIQLDLAGASVTMLNNQYEKIVDVSVGLLSDAVIYERGRVEDRSQFGSNRDGAAGNGMYKVVGGTGGATAATKIQLLDSYVYGNVTRPTTYITGSATPTIGSLRISGNKFPDKTASPTTSSGATVTTFIDDGNTINASTQAALDALSTAVYTKTSINDASTNSTTETYSVNKIRALIAAVQSGDAGTTTTLKAVGRWNPMNDTVATAPAGLTTYYVPVKMITGSGDTTGLVLNFPAWYTPNTNTGSATDLGNDINITEASLQTTTTSTPITFNGSRTAVVPNGKNLLSDTITPAQLGFTGGVIPVGTVLFMKMKATVMSGGKIPNSPRNLYGQSNLSGWFYDIAATTVPSVDLIANSTTGYTGTKPVDAGNLYAPVLLGTYKDPNIKAYAAWGDSIESGYNDLTPGYLGGGFFQRALAQFATPMASINFGISGAKSQSLITDARILDYFKYVPDGLHIMMGTNDFGISSPPTAAAIISNIDAFVARYKNAPGVKAGVKVVVSRLLPRTTSTDQFTTEANQTINVNWNPGEVVSQFNNLITTSKYDSVIVNDVVRGTNVSKWVVTGAVNYATSDGTHPNNQPGGSLLLANTYTPVLQAAWGETIGTIVVTGVSVTPSSMAGVVNGTAQATVAFTPSNATTKTGVWASSNTAVATVNSSGLVTFVAVGTANITFTSTDGSKVGTTAVTVSAANVAVTSVTLSQTSVSGTAGGTLQLTATVNPTNATNRAVTWTSSNTSVATVNSSGLVTFIAAGTANITVITASDSKSAVCALTITAASTSAPSTVSANFVDFGGDWVNGVWGGAQDKAIVLIENNSVNLAAFVTGVTVTFVDGRTLVIESTEVGSNYIKLGFNATRLPQSLGAPNTLKAPAPAAGSTDPVVVTPTTPGTAGPIALAGVNMSGLGSNPHVDNSIASVGTHYRDVEQKYIDKYSGLGCKVIRMPIAPERAVDYGGSPLREAYMVQLKSALDRLAAAGMKAILDPHTYMRLYTTVSESYNNSYGYGEARFGGFRKLWIPIGAPDCLMTKAQYADFLTKLATRFGGHPGCLGIGIANEPFSRSQDPFNVVTQYIADAQYYKNAITAGSQTCNIYVGGGEYCTAYHWPSVSDALKNITDPYGQVVYEAHQYLDGNLGGGGYWANRNESIPIDNFVKMVKPFTDWLAANGKRGILGEMGFPAGNTSAAQATAKGLAFTVSVGLPVFQWCAGAGWSPDDVNAVDDDNLTYKNNLDPIKSVFNKTTSAYGSPGA